MLGRVRAYAKLHARRHMVMFGSIAEAPSWLLDLSPFAHVAPVPAVAADPTSSAGRSFVGVAAAVAGAAAFTRRYTATD